MKVRIAIKLKQNILDIQGKSIESSIKDNIGIKTISHVTQGKIIDLDIAENNQEKITKIVDELCDKLLVNMVMEEYSFEILS
jgi:phosphoribosylformylglycinamidine synthase PurS subunit